MEATITNPKTHIARAMRTFANKHNLEIKDKHFVCFVSDKNRKTYRQVRWLRCDLFQADAYQRQVALIIIGHTSPGVQKLQRKEAEITCMVSEIADVLNFCEDMINDKEHYPTFPKELIHLAYSNTTDTVTRKANRYMRRKDEERWNHCKIS